MGPFKLISHIFMALASVARSVERGGMALEHVATIAEEEALGLKDQMRVERESRQVALVAKLKAA